jgi:hypothetical protein
MQTRPMADSCPNSLGIPLHKRSAYPQEFGLLAQFGHPSVNGRPNCESNEFRETRVVATKSERQTMTLDQR